MGWIQDVFKPVIAQIKSDINARAVIFRKSDDASIPVSIESADAFDDILIHGASLLLQKKGSESTGYYILDPNDIDLPIGIINSGVESASGATIHTLQMLGSNSNKGLNSEVSDASTAVLVRKKNADGNSAGYVVAVSDDAGSTVSDDTDLIQLINGWTNPTKIFGVSSNAIYHKKQGDASTSTIPGGYTALWTPDGQLITGENLNDLNTSNKELVQAINEVLAIALGDGSLTSTNILPFGISQIWQGPGADPTVSELQEGDVAMMWITETLWIHGRYRGGDITDLDNNWDIMGELDITGDPLPVPAPDVP